MRPKRRCAPVQQVGRAGSRRRSSPRQIAHLVAQAVEDSLCPLRQAERARPQRARFSGRPRVPGRPTGPIHFGWRARPDDWRQAARKTGRPGDRSAALPRVRTLSTNVARSGRAAIVVVIGRHAQPGQAGQIFRAPVSTHARSAPRHGRTRAPVNIRRRVRRCSIHDLPPPLSLYPAGGHLRPVHPHHVYLREGRADEFRPELPDESATRRCLLVIPAPMPKRSSAVKEKPKSGDRIGPTLHLSNQPAIQFEHRARPSTRGVPEAPRLLRLRSRAHSCPPSPRSSRHKANHGPAPKATGAKHGAVSSGNAPVPHRERKRVERPITTEPTARTELARIWRSREAGGQIGGS